MELHWKISSFEQLPVEELYRILQLRTEVFVVEQNCVFQDLDNLDRQALHLMGWEQGELIAYARLFDRGIVSSEPSIGRVVTARGCRGKGIGKMLMGKAISAIFELYGKQSLYISAQCYLERFYGSFGFITHGSSYMEDGILHVKMILP